MSVQLRLETECVDLPIAPPNSPTSELGGATALIDDLPSLSLDRLNIYEKKSVLVVGISGCTSSGKSLLAAILNEVFNGSVIMHQDMYFQPKALCPFVTFRSTYNDLAFTAKSVINNELGEYTITSDAIHSLNIDISNETTCGSTTTQPIQDITGPDTDRDEAIDFLSMLGMVTQVIETAELPDTIEYPGNPGLILGNPQILTNEHQLEDLTPYEDLIKELRHKVSKEIKNYAWTNIKDSHEGKFIRPYAPTMPTKSPTASDLDIKSLLPKICFLEGFLLYTNPSVPVQNSSKSLINHHLPQGIDFDLEFEQEAVRDQYQSIADLTHELAVTSPQDPFSIEARNEIQSEIWGKNITAKYLLQPKMDIKLFLPTEKDTAMKRRFARPAYIDIEKGGERVPGEMWKCEGYFQDVVWPNYVKEHGWLLGWEREWFIEDEDEECGFREGGVYKGVYVRPKVDAGVDETVRWAVEVLMNRLLEGEEVVGEVVEEEN